MTQAEPTQTVDRITTEALAILGDRDTLVVVGPAHTAFVGSVIHSNEGEPMISKRRTLSSFGFFRASTPPTWSSRSIRRVGNRVILEPFGAEDVVPFKAHCGLARPISILKAKEEVEVLGRHRKRNASNASRSARPAVALRRPGMPHRATPCC